MASDVDVCNMALSLIGSDAIVTSIDPVDGSVEAGHCARFLRQARTEMLDAYTWRWSKRRVVLAAVDNPSLTWAYAYGIPSDMLSATRVLNSFTLSDYDFAPYYGYASASELALFNERGTADFEIEGSTLLTNEPDAVLLYTVDVADLTKWTPGAITALAYLLASFLAGPLIKGDAGANVGGKMRQIATKLGAAAMARDANSGAEPAFELAGSIRARA